MELFQVGTRFQNPDKKIVIEIFGEEGFAPNRIFLTGELHRLFETGYSGIKISEQDLETKLLRNFIQIVSSR